MLRFLSRRTAFLPAVGLALLVATSAALAQGSCTGDCSGDDSVTVDEIVQLVNIALGNALLDGCPAGDSSGDGQVTVDELQAAITLALGGCRPSSTATPTASPTEVPTGVATAVPSPTATATVTASPTLTATATSTPTATSTATPTITATPTGLRIWLSSTSGRPGDTVTVTGSLSGADADIVAAASDLSYARGLLRVATTGTTGTRPDCTIAARIGADTSADKMLTSSILPSGGDQETVRLGVFGFSQSALGDGELYSCRFVIDATAPPGTVLIMNLAGVADRQGEDLPADGGAGRIEVVQ